MNIIDKAQLADLSVVSRINSLLRTGVRDFYWDSSGYVGSAIEQQRCFVIRRDGSVQASLILENRAPSPEFPYRSLAIGTLAVRPGRRRQGLGTGLVELAKTRAFQQNTPLFVESFYEYGKPNFYKKLGFRQQSPKNYRGRPYHVLCFLPRTIPVFPKMKRIGLRDRLEFLSYLQKTPIVPSDITFENLFAFDSPSRKTYLASLNDNVVIFIDKGDWRGFYPVVGADRMDDTILDCLEWLRDQGSDKARDKDRDKGSDKARDRDRDKGSDKASDRDRDKGSDKASDRDHKARHTKRDRESPPLSGCFTCVPLTVAQGLMPATRSRLKIAAERKSFDYLYDANALFDFDSPGLRTQRQNLERFLKRRPELRIVGPSGIRDVAKFQKRWLSEYLVRMGGKDSRLPDVIAREDKAIRKALAHAGSLDLRIGVLYADCVSFGFSIAGIFAQTAYIHFEKASRQRGAYQALLHLFGKSALAGDVICVNREQDLGVPGLRANKMRYRPAGFVEKCRLALR